MKPNVLYLIVAAFIGTCIAGGLLYFFVPTTFDWFTWGMGILQGSIVGVLSGVVLLFVIFPRMSVKTGKTVLNAAKDDPDIANLIKSAKEAIAAAKPFVDAVKQIQPEDVDALIKALKGFTGTTPQQPIFLPPIPEIKIGEETITVNS